MNKYFKSTFVNNILGKLKLMFKNKVIKHHRSVMEINLN